MRPFVKVRAGVGETEPEEDGSRWKRAFWGLFLIGLGSAFLLDRLGIVELPSLGRLWPAVFLVIAASKLAEGRPGAAVTFAGIGAWVFACKEGWYGLDYHDSWGLVLVAVGAGIVIRALTREDDRRRDARAARRGGVL